MSAYTPYLEVAPGADLTAVATSYSWSDYTDRVWMRDKITRTWGKQNRFPNATPAKLTLTLTNDDGLWVPDLPTSPLYGLIDQNTPLRLLMAPVENTASDAFGRTASSSWGSPDSGPSAWTIVGTASDYSVGSGAGRHTNTSTASSHFSTLAFSIVRADVKVKVRVNALSTGAAQYAGVTCRYVDSGNQQRADIQFATSGVLTARLVSRVASVDSVTSTATLAFTHSTSQWYWIRLQTGLTSARVKVWQDGSAEPRGWNIDGASGTMLVTTAGATGVFSRRDAGSTNTNPTTDFDDFASTDGPYILQTCFVDEWPTEYTDLTGNQALAKISASGRLRQLQNAKPLRSALYRALSRAPEMVAYWPLEEKSGATSFTGVPGLPAISFSDVSPGSDSNVVGSESLPVFGGASHIGGTVPWHAPTASWSLRFTAKVPQSPDPSGGQLLSWFTTGSAISRWQITITAATPDTLRVDGYNALGVPTTSSTVNFVDSSSGAELSNGRQLYIEVDGTQNGTGTDVVVKVWFAPDDRGSTSSNITLSTTFASTVPSNITSWYFDGVTGFTAGGVVLGHVAIGTSAFGPGIAGVCAHAGELTSSRLARLGAEEKISTYFGDILGEGAGATTQVMGPQAIKSLYGHLQQIETTETGVVFDGPQGQTTILPRSLRRNHPVNLVLDVDQGHVGWPIKRTWDDQLLVNEVTASRPGGTDRTVSDDALIAKLGYKPQQLDVNSYSDAELLGHAQWWLAQGTVRKARYPQVPLVLHRNPDLIRDYLEMGVGGRIQVTNLPGPLPPDDLDLIAEGGADVIDPFEWRALINASDGTQWQVGTWDTSGKKYGCGACTTAEDLDTTETGIDVAIADTCTWRHASGDYNIIVGGEVMTVTAASVAAGSVASWTQTLTVIRSVNGVVKSHVTGAQVRLADPAKWGL